MATYDLTSSIPSSSSLKTGDILNCPYSGTYKTITLPKGQYKLECWGAQGGYRSDSTYGGKGGYSVGTITLITTTTMYLYSGGAGNTGGINGGFNGGGLRDGCNGGGGASDIRITANDLQSRVIVAGGGGSDGATNKTGMYGGGTSGGTATQNYGSGGSGGTQTAGGAGGNNNSGSFGVGGKGIHYASGYGGAGGGGWYGGGGAYPDGSRDDDRGGGGGSGFVWTGSNAPNGYRLGSQYYLNNANTVAGNSSFTSPTGSSETGHSGNGYIRITIQSIVDWAYSTVSIPAPTYNKQDTSSWTLSPSTCRYFSFTPTISGDFIVYSNSSIDTYGYLTSNITSLNSRGQPSSNILVSNDDYAKKYGGTGANFGICYNVTAGTTYYIYVKPYHDSTANSSVYLTYYMAHPDSRVYVKTNSTTWKLITN